MSIVYLILSIFFIVYYKIRYKDILHPIMLFLAGWYLAAALSAPKISNYLNEWSIEMHFVVIFSGISFWFGSLLTTKKLPLQKSKLQRKKVNIAKTFDRLTIFLFLICLMAAILEWINGGAKFSFLELGNIEGTDVKSEFDGSIPGVHYATLFLPFVSAFAFFSLMNNTKYKITNVIIIVFSIFSSFLFNLSRGDLLIFILSFIFIYSRYHKISKKQIFIISSLTGLMFVGIMVLRVNQETLAFMMTENPYYSVFYSYIAPCFANLNDLVNSNIGYHLYGNATFAPLWTIIGVKEELPVYTIDQMGVFNARTYLYSFFHDFKYFGIIFFPFLIGNITNRIYVLTRLHSGYWIILLAAMQKAILNSFFGNYFFGEMVILFPYLLITIIIIYHLHKKKIINFTGYENFSNK